jgi:hypothetical protein
MQAGCMLNYKTSRTCSLAGVGLIAPSQVSEPKVSFLYFYCRILKPILRAVGEPIACLILGLQEQILRAEFRPID